MSPRGNFDERFSHRQIMPLCVRKERRAASSVDLESNAMTQEETLLALFPKRGEHYRRNREGASTASSRALKMEEWMHQSGLRQGTTRRDCIPLETALQSEFRNVFMSRQSLERTFPHTR
jgi:hypothetical protein